jgi:hypothetical protein
MRLVRKAGDRNAERRVEDRKSESAKQADLRVGDMQVAADRFDQQRQNLAVDERTGVREREHQHDEPGICRPRPGRLLVPRGRPERARRDGRR